MDQNLAEGQIEPSGSGNLLMWLIGFLIIGLLLGGGYWFYNQYIVKSSKPGPTPSMEVTTASWKVKTDKVINDFLDFWSKSSPGKARDLLTIAAQAKLATFKDDSGNIIGDISIELDKFINVTAKTNEYEIVGTKLLNDRTVETQVRLIYNQSPPYQDRVFSLVSENNLWLIDSIDSVVSSLSPSPTITTSPR